MTEKETPRPLPETTKIGIRRMLEKGASVEGAARWFGCSKNQVLGIKSHMNRKPRKTQTTPKKTTPKRRARVLDETTKQNIRIRLQEGMTIDEIADRFDCSKNQVCGIKSQMPSVRWSGRRPRSAEIRQAEQQLTTPESHVVTPDGPFRRAEVSRNIVRIDASNFDEVILVNGEREIAIQITS